MDVINQIIRESAIGPLSKWYKSFVLLLFTSIVLMALFTLVLLIKNGPHMTITYGY